MSFSNESIEGFALPRSDQPLRTAGGFTDAIARQPLQGVCALACRGQFERRERPHRFENLVQRTSRN